MKTPIFDFVKQYASSEISRFHMPGHKGIPSALGCEPLDITEVEGADVLYSPCGIIAESEENATSLFETAHTFYSAEGSSLSIKAMLALATERTGNKRPLILAARNAHKAFLYACALLDAEVHWLYPGEESHLCSCVLTPEDVEEALMTFNVKPSAVYLTSPDYLGQISDIKGIARVCHAHGVPLLVDNAHGAYLKFLKPSLHPMDLGADLCCDSAHKTLPVLTGGAYLHISKSADPSLLERARELLSVFASTSPSYLILQSLDLCNAYLADGYREKLSACVQKVNDVKQRLARMGFEAEASEPLKIVFQGRRFGYTGEELAEHLRLHRIEAEFADDSILVLMVTPSTRECDLERLLKAFQSLSPKAPLPLSSIPSPHAHHAQRLSIREAIFSSCERVSVENAVGRICAAPTVSCPPAIPIVVSGEVITRGDTELFRFYGIDSIAVVK